MFKRTNYWDLIRILKISNTLFTDLKECINIVLSSNRIICNGILYSHKKRNLAIYDNMNIPWVPYIMLSESQEKTNTV